MGNFTKIGGASSNDSPDNSRSITPKKKKKDVNIRTDYGRSETSEVIMNEKRVEISTITPKLKNLKSSQGQVNYFSSKSRKEDSMEIS